MTPLDPTFGPTFRPRDRVAADDLTEWQRVPLFAAARHFRGLHRLYGVADGLIVTTAGNAFAVTRGVAFDAYGRPLSLDDGVTPRCPVLPDGLLRRPYLLVLRGSRPDTQPPDVPVPAPQAGAVELIEPADVRPWDVPLAGLTVRRTPATPTAPATTTVKADMSVRAVAVRTFRRPYLATGSVPSGTTAIPLTAQATPTGWAVWVAATAAGFLPLAEATAATPAGRPPVYLVSVGRPTAADAAKLRNGQLVLDVGPPATRPPTITVSDASPRGFLLTVDYGDEAKGLNGLTATPLAVSWTGIEERVEMRPLKRNPDTVKAEGVTVTQTTDRPSLPWPTFRDDQRLQAADLNDLQETLRALQRLHNRGLHDWGVVGGCAVAVADDRREVHVQPGTALDIDGRELVLPDAVRLGVPARKVTDGPTAAKPWWVTAAYRDGPAPRDADPSRRMAGVPVRRLPVAIVRWRDPEANEPDDRLEPGYDVILATVMIDRGEVTAVETTGRRSAVPPKRPYVSAGRSGPSSELADAKWSANPDTLELVIEIDTSAGGFVTAPHYTIQVEVPTRSPGPSPADVAFGDPFDEWVTEVRVAARERPPASPAFRLDSVAVIESRPTRVWVAVSLVVADDLMTLLKPVVPKVTAANGPAEAARWWSRFLFWRAADTAPLPADVTLTRKREWVTHNLVGLLPYRFAWVGIEV